METSIQNGRVIFTEGTDRFTITLHRTLRLPEDGKTHNLPPSLGHFPVKRVEDYKAKVPKEWLEHGGVFFPMWQREAMWLAFNSSERPFACKVAAGKINAVSGKPWTKELAPSDTTDSGDPRQDYLVAPPQKWLDGFNSGNGIIQQFVAMPLGMGYTVEGQVTGQEEFGGLQVMAIPPKAKPWIKRRPTNPLRSLSDSTYGPLIGAPTVYSASAENCAFASLGPQLINEHAPSLQCAKATEMGLAAGGAMAQKIYPDTYGLDTWDVAASGRMFIHIVNSEMYEQITGEKPPKSQITAQVYAQHGYPWYSVWDTEMGDVGPSKTLAGVKTISQKDKEHGFTGLQDDSTLNGPLWASSAVSPYVKDGVW